jgi:hypothetical protein
VSPIGTSKRSWERLPQRFPGGSSVIRTTVCCHPGQPPQKLTAELRTRVLERTRQAPPDSSMHWSLRKMAAAMKVNKNLIARIWKEADLKPHRLDRSMASNDPQFEEKAAAIIGLYLNPPQNAAVFCVDEKSAIQALDRLDRCETCGVLWLDRGELSRIVAAPDRDPQLESENVGVSKTLPRR